MLFTELLDRAKAIRAKYAVYEQIKGRKAWTPEQTMQGFVSDVGKLSKYVMAKEGYIDEEYVDVKLASELADCLYSVLILADEYGINLEETFRHKLEQIEKKISH